MVRLKAGVLVAAAALAIGGAARADDDGGRTALPAAFFAGARPSSAYDMLQRVPGFSFDPGDNEVRGLAGSGGNVLIDGRRPTGKQDGLEDVLKRIPAGSVERIELIRAGAAGVDMQGRALVANVVRRREAEVRGQLEAELAAYPDGRLGPRLSGEISRSAGGRLLELSAAIGREAEDDKGRGPKLRFGATGTLIEAADYSEREWEDSAEAAVGYETPLGGGALRIDGSARRADVRANIRERTLLPSASTELVSEREDLFQAEGGGQYRRDVGPWSTELFALHRWSWSHAQDVSREADEMSAVRETYDASESIVRALGRRDIGSWTVQAGAEAAFNVLDSHSGLFENGEAIDLPFADVRVEERRAEATATATWRARPTLTVEAAARLERSVLRQSGDSQLEKRLTYWKPRLLVSWRATPQQEMRLELERRVGQLDFGDFISSTSLTSQTVTAGNPELEPERSWRLSATWDRKFGRAGGVTLALRHDRIENAVDHVLIEGPGFALDAIGNIGRGSRTEAQVTASLPLDVVGVAGGLLRANVTWRDSRVTDPFTGEERRLSAEPKSEGELHFTQELPRWSLSWGLSADLAVTETKYLFDEVRTDVEEARLAAFVEYRPAPAWRVRLEAENLGSGRVLRRRVRFDGPRGEGALRGIETREMDFGPFVALRLRRSLGGS